MTFIDIAVDKARRDRALQEAENARRVRRIRQQQEEDTRQRPTPRRS